LAQIDYEAEYNNGARIPEESIIFAAWTRAAAEYRAQAAQQSRAELGIRYGTTARQTIDLFHPTGTAPSPLAVFIHGGYWRSLGPWTFSHMARGLNAHGVKVAVLGYDLCPAVTVGAIVNEIQQACRHLWYRLGQRMLVCGHSAGGHLAACMLATNWREMAPDLPADLVPAACPISGVFDLAPLVGVAMNKDLCLELTEARCLSPLFWSAPAGRTVDIVVGALESNEFLRQSRSLAEKWAKAGVIVRLEETPRANHFTVIDGVSDPESAITSRLAKLAPKEKGSI
jgi:arylformamidase